ncbi:M20/M25/M40 family metallo-hydrolase [Erythrobacter sp. MTPC3]|uniref:M20/M25/M40 family metallo-hydrolase n=1 Tax=Erythrobacter sp. MTPC3 TaxID=3056564 RepID=UPI0036F2D799
MTIKRGAIALALAGSTILAGCGGAPLASVPASERAQIELALMRDIAVLASDEFGGRQPGTMGEGRTVDFIIKNLQDAGLTSGTNDPGSAWRAPVDLLRTKPSGSRLMIQQGETESELAGAVAFTLRKRELINDAELVFVGKLSDEVPSELVTGQVIVMLGEPGVSPQRRTVLFDKNPAAIITVVEDDDAIANVNRAYGRERLSLASEAETSLTAFASQAAIANVLGADNWAELLASAEDGAFQPIALNATVSIEATTQRTEFTSYNVIGKLPGTRPNSGAVLLLGHWDHFGECGDDGDEDRICNGAVDNASGIAAMLELTRRLSATGPYDRDIYVLATSAEESGLLGAKAFIENPPIPTGSIVAAFNFDSVAIAPAGSAVGFIGEGRTPLDPVIIDVLNKSNRTLGDREFAAQFIQRQDGWALLEGGVPAVFLSTAFGSEIVTGPYLSTHYHRASDELDKIELGGAIDDLLLHEELVRRIVDTSQYMPPAAP